MKKFQGYTNYETWCINLWLRNEEGTYNYCTELAEQATREDHPKSFLADRLREMIGEGNPLPDQANIYSDLLTNAITSANWFEIAEGFLKDVEETEE